jgi:hypothetical protein
MGELVIWSLAPTEDVVDGAADVELEVVPDKLSLCRSVSSSKTWKILTSEELVDDGASLVVELLGSNVVKSYKALVPLTSSERANSVQRPFILSTRRR